MTTQEIILALNEGQNFQNDSANWYSLCKPSQNRFILVINESNFFYKNIQSVSKRISKLIKRGY
jgi:hypothetical protein